MLCLSGCASVTAQDTQSISVATIPAGATCTLSNKLGAWAISSTPASASVHRSFSPLRIDCKKGALSESQTLEPNTRGRAYGNILLLGIPAYVDAATGAGYEYSPDNVTLTLASTPATPSIPQAAPHPVQPH